MPKTSGFNLVPKVHCPPNPHIFSFKPQMPGLQAVYFKLGQRVLLTICHFFYAFAFLSASNPCVLQDFVPFGAAALLTSKQLKT